MIIKAVAGTSVLWATFVVLAVAVGKQTDRQRGAPEDLCLTPMMVDSLLLEVRLMQMQWRNVCYGLAMNAGENPVTACD
jgi:hypothetical protein